MCAPTPCQHLHPISRARLNTLPLEVVWDPLVRNMARSCCNIECGTWNSWLKDMLIEKRRPGCWGQRTLVQMASWVWVWRGNKEVAAQETRKLGKKTAESLAPNVIIIQLLEELRVRMCAHSYAVLNCRRTNDFYHFFPRVFSAQRVNWGCVTKDSCSLQNPFLLCGRLSWGKGGLLKERRSLLWLGCEL